MSTFRAKLLQIIKHPLKSYLYLYSLFRGLLFKSIGPVVGIKIKAGKKLKISGKVIFKGPGQIVVGDNVHFCGTANSICTPWTSSPNAVIKIGSNTFLNGTRFNCKGKITIGKDCIIADARISDNDGHSVKINRRQIPDSDLVVRHVLIEENVWIAAGSYILKGVTIGKNSVIGAASVVSSDIPENVIAAGNPCKVVKTI